MRQYPWLVFLPLRLSLWTLFLCSLSKALPAPILTFRQFTWCLFANSSQIQILSLASWSRTSSGHIANTGLLSIVSLPMPPAVWFFRSLPLACPSVSFFLPTACAPCLVSGALQTLWAAPTPGPGPRGPVHTQIHLLISRSLACKPPASRHLSAGSPLPAPLPGPVPCVRSYVPLSAAQAAWSCQTSLGTGQQALLFSSSNVVLPTALQTPDHCQTISTCGPSASACTLRRT